MTETEVRAVVEEVLGAGAVEVLAVDGLRVTLVVGRPGVKVRDLEKRLRAATGKCWDVLVEPRRA